MDHRTGELFFSVKGMLLRFVAAAFRSTVFYFWLEYAQSLLSHVAIKEVQKAKCMVGSSQAVYI